jgi:cell wall-associated NlpC family hydrolase
MAGKGTAVACIGVGGLFLYSAIQGKSILSATRKVVSGESPKAASTLPQQEQFAQYTAAGTLSATTDSAIANAALKYNGSPQYTWGGVPANGEWDCSSFVNMVCGMDLSLPIPGYPAGSYNGQSHGPIVSMWALSPLLNTITSDGNLAEAGDIVCYLPDTHMGIAIGNGQMISAQDPELGVGVSTIDGADLGPVIIRRYLTSTAEVVPSG